MEKMMKGIHNVHPNIVYIKCKYIYIYYIVNVTNNNSIIYFKDIFDQTSLKYYRKNRSINSMWKYLKFEMKYINLDIVLNVLSAHVGHCKFYDAHLSCAWRSIIFYII